MTRLSAATLSLVPASARPPVHAADLGIGLVHLGIGAFHRAHQAVYTQAAMAASGDLRWGICGVTQRSTTVVEQLAPQDGLYTVLERGSGEPRPHVIAAVRRVLSAQGHAADVVATIASPDTQIVTLTVTEKGYRHDPASGRLRADDAGTRSDAAGGDPATVVGQLVRGLQARQWADAGPLSVVSCDNLPGNGAVLRGLVEDFCRLLPAAEGEPLAAWIATCAAFPSTMVDRIVPSTTGADRDEVRRLLGVSDEGVVVAEPFSQWVIEDAFAGDRPRWELAGATLTSDVAPYEAMKLRLLNGSHSALAYLGALAGHEFIADVVRVPHFEAFARDLMGREVTPTLRVPDGFDLPTYRQQVLERFANPALRHRTTQIAMDGSQKLPQRLLGTVRDRFAAGAEPRLACLAVAAWMRYVTTGATDAGRPLPVDDPLAQRFAAFAGLSPAQTVSEMLAVREVFGVDLPDVAAFRRLVTESLSLLQTAGADAAVRSLTD